MADDPTDAAADMASARVVVDDDDFAGGCEASYIDWWGGMGGWIQTVKDTSASAMELVKETSASAVEIVKKDLNEFSQTMQCDTSRTAARIKENIKTDEQAHQGGHAKLKAGISTILGGISKMLMVEPDSDDDSEEVVIGRTGPVFDRAKARLHSIQTDPATYLDEPDNIDQFHLWLDDFQVDDRKGEISELLVSKPEIRSIYTQAVPSEISHSLFWQRYFYRMHRLALDEQRRDELKRRAELQTSMHEDLEPVITDDWVDFDGPSSPIKKSYMDRIPRLRDELHNSTDENMTIETTVEQISDISLDRGLSIPGDDVHDIESKPDIPVPKAHPEHTTCDIMKPVVSPERSSNTELSEPDQSKQHHTEPIPESVDSPPSDVTQELSIDVKTREKGDMVVVGGRNGATPTDSTASKDSVTSGLDEDWDEVVDDGDTPITDQELAREMAKSMYTDATEEVDWDDWE